MPIQARAHPLRVARIPAPLLGLHPVLGDLLAPEIPVRPRRPRQTEGVEDVGAQGGAHPAEQLAARVVHAGGRARGGEHAFGEHPERPVAGMVEGVRGRGAERVEDVRDADVGVAGLPAGQLGHPPLADLAQRGG